MVNKDVYTIISDAVSGATTVAEAVSLVDNLYADILKSLKDDLIREHLEFRMNNGVISSFVTVGDVEKVAGKYLK